VSGRETKPADWDAGTYSRVSIPQRVWSAAVLDRLPLGGAETVLDAGCGTGEVTEALLQKLPRGRVIAVDGSPSMVEKARERLPADRADVICRNLTELDMDQVADHAFSNAVFHWIKDHDRLFAQLFRAIRPGGLLVAQCGGRGNVAEKVHALATVRHEEPFRDAMEGFEDPWNFAGAEETAGRLENAGFAEVECSLEERVARPKDPRAFMQASGLAPVRQRMTPELFEQFTDRMMEVMGEPETFQYVRLNIKAMRPGD
jgi:trans-aconitate 2-methyltransferase